jgi:hypothetical protein
VARVERESYDSLLDFGRDAQAARDVRTTLAIADGRPDLDGHAEPRPGAIEHTAAFTRSETSHPRCPSATIGRGTQPNHNHDPGEQAAA